MNPRRVCRDRSPVNNSVRMCLKIRLKNTSNTRYAFCRVVFTDLESRNKPHTISKLYQNDWYVRVVLIDHCFISVFPEISVFQEKRKEEFLDSEKVSLLFEIIVHPTQNIPTAAFLAEIVRAAAQLEAAWVVGRCPCLGE